jgi:hypothetical protein
VIVIVTVIYIYICVLSFHFAPSYVLDGTR